MIKYSEKKYEACAICNNCGSIEVVSLKLGNPLHSGKCPYCGCTGYLELFDCDCDCE